MSTSCPPARGREVCSRNAAACVLEEGRQEIHIFLVDGLSIPAAIQSSGDPVIGIPRGRSPAMYVTDPREVGRPHVRRVAAGQPRNPGSMLIRCHHGAGAHPP